jgi:hypothetical protein
LHHCDAGSIPAISIAVIDHIINSLSRNKATIA